MASEVNFPLVRGLSTTRLGTVMVSGLALILLLKLYFASVLDLYSDEIFYWLASTRPALAYSDLPFVTATLAGLFTDLAPGSTLAVRLPFILLGSSTPLILYWLARPIVGHRQALEAGALVICLPPGGFLGQLAVPDVPLIVLGLVALGLFERALRSNHWMHWLGVGTAVALGLSTHYRFVLYPSAVLLAILACGRLRPLIGQSRFWSAIVIATLGLAPILWFNLSHEMSSASFYLVERHPWQFQADGLWHLPKQIGLVTPPLYALLLLTAWRMWQRSKAGDCTAAFLLSVTSLHLGIYFVLAPWADTNSTTIHWPLSGYFPLLIYLPHTLREVADWLRSRYSDKTATSLLVVVPALGFAGTLAALVGIGSQAWQKPLQSWLEPALMSNKMAGWQPFAEHTSELLAQHFEAEHPIVITGNYYTAAQLEFAGVTQMGYTIDRDKAVRDGRLQQFQLWGRDESALAGLGEQSFLYITEDSTLFLPARYELMTSICELASSVRFLDQLDLFDGEKRFSFYAGRLGDFAIAAADSYTQSAERRATPCPYPSRAWIDVPKEDTRVSGDLLVSGWAYNEDLGVSEVSVLIDGQVVSQAQYGTPRPDVVLAEKVRTDPHAPHLGFQALIDSRTLDNGRHSLAIQVINSAGGRLRYGARPIIVAN